MYSFPFLLQIPTSDSRKKDENTRKTCHSPKQSQKQRTDRQINTEDTLKGEGKFPTAEERCVFAAQ